MGQLRRFSKDLILIEKPNLTQEWGHLPRIKNSQCQLIIMLPP